MATPTTVPLMRVEDDVFHQIDRLHPELHLTDGARCLGCGATWEPDNNHGQDVLDWAMTHNTPARQTYTDRQRPLTIDIVPLSSYVDHPSHGTDAA